MIMTLNRISCLTLAASLSLSAPAWAAVDWSKVQGKEVVMLYPGQTSWEWNLTDADHSAATKFKQGQNCAQCHRGEEKRQGDLMVSGKKAEPNPIAGFPGYVVSTVKFAYDDQALYVRLDFKEPAAPDAKMDPLAATKVSLILNDALVPEGVRAGCWASCHEDSASMPTAPQGVDRSHYLMKTRVKMSRQGGGDAIKPAEDLAKLQEAGYLQEWWQARLSPGTKAQASSGVIFDKREEIKPGAVQVEASQANGSWSVILSRPLNAPAPYRPLQTGKVYSVGFGVHLGHSAKRFHHTSYEFTFALGDGQADFVAAKQ